MHTKKDSDLRVGTNLDWLAERMRLSREDYARSWHIQKESADKIVLGQRGITSDKVYALFDDYAITPNEIFLGKGHNSEARQKIIELRGHKYVGDYKILTPEIIVDDIDALAPSDRDEMVRRLIKMLSLLL